MKSSDFLDENLFQTARNWAGGKGYLGKGEYIKAQNTNAKEYGRSDFISKLKAALESGMQAGTIAETVYHYSKINYNKFNNLLENRIIAESITVDDYLKKYIGALIKSYTIDPSEKSTLNTLISNFSSAYATAYPRGEFPTNEANKLWDWIWAVGSAQQRDPRTQEVIGEPEAKGQQAIPIGAQARDIPPDQTAYSSLPIAATEPIPVVQVATGRGGNRNFQYMFDRSAWFDVTDPSMPKIVNDVASIQKLNVLYHRKYRI